MPDTYRILAINPGSTSTKISVFENEREVWTIKLTHSQEELSEYGHIFDQYEFRKGVILNALSDADFEISSFDAIVGRGGVLYPIEGGTYSIDDRLIEDLHKGVQGEHFSNLGAPIARELSITASCPAFIVDPVVVDVYGSKMPLNQVAMAKAAIWPSPTDPSAIPKANARISSGVRAIRSRFLRIVSWGR